MKTKCLRMCILSMAAGGLVLMSGCVVEPNGTLGLALPTVQVAAPVVVATPGVVVEAPVLVPETYVWDGYENVGFVGGQFFYLGPGDVWVVAEPWRLDRFHGWERDHPDWRNHAIRNDRFRRDAHGHEAARHDDRPGAKAKPGEKGKPAAKKDEKK